MPPALVVCLTTALQTQDLTCMAAYRNKWPLLASGFTGLARGPALQ
jgi:hypothetical protein